MYCEKIGSYSLTQEEIDRINELKKEAGSYSEKIDFQKVRLEKNELIIDHYGEVYNEVARRYEKGLVKTETYKIPENSIWKNIGSFDDYKFHLSLREYYPVICYILYQSTKEKNPRIPVNIYNFLKSQNYDLNIIHFSGKYIYRHYRSYEEPYYTLLGPDDNFFNNSFNLMWGSFPGIIYQSDLLKNYNPKYDAYFPTLMLCSNRYRFYLHNFQTFLPLDGVRLFNGIFLDLVEYPIYYITFSYIAGEGLPYEGVLRYVKLENYLNVAHFGFALREDGGVFLRIVYDYPRYHFDSSSLPKYDLGDFYASEKDKKFYANLVKNYNIELPCDIYFYSFLSPLFIKYCVVKSYSELYRILGKAGYIYIYQPFDKELYKQLFSDQFKKYNKDGKWLLLRPFAEIQEFENFFKNLNLKNFRAFTDRTILHYFFWLNYDFETKKIKIRLEDSRLVRDGYFTFYQFSKSFHSEDVTDSYLKVVIEKLLAEYPILGKKTVDLLIAVSDTDAYFWDGDPIPDTFDENTPPVNGEWKLIRGDGKPSLESLIPEEHLTRPDCFYLYQRFRFYDCIKIFDMRVELVEPDDPHNHIKRPFYHFYYRRFSDFSLNKQKDDRVIISKSLGGAFLGYYALYFHEKKIELPFEIAYNKLNPNEVYIWEGDPIPDNYDPNIKINGKWVPLLQFEPRFYYPSNPVSDDPYEMDFGDGGGDIDPFGKLNPYVNYSVDELAKSFTLFKVFKEYDFPRNPDEIREKLTKNMDTVVLGNYTIRDLLNSDSFLNNRLNNFKYAQLDSNDTKEYSILIRIFNPELKNYEVGRNWSPNIVTKARYILFSDGKYVDAFNGLGFNKSGLTKGFPDFDWEKINEIDIKKLYNAEWVDYLPNHDCFYYGTT